MSANMKQATGAVNQRVESSEPDRSGAVLTLELNGRRHGLSRVIAYQADGVSASLSTKHRFLLVCLPDLSNRRAVLRYASDSLRVLSAAQPPSGTHAKNDRAIEPGRQERRCAG